MTNVFQAQDIHGVNPIVAMPFTEHGEVDESSFVRLLEQLAATGAQGTTLFGIASEFPKLNDDERDRLAQIYVTTLAGGKQYRAMSVTDHSTEQAVWRARRYAALGADALMLLPPFFLQPSPQAIQEHIYAVLDAVDIPVMVQYAPGETGLPITPEQLANVARRYPHAVFKIECHPPVDYTRAFLNAAPGACVLNGYAGLYMLEMLAAGGKGVMPGCSFTEVYVNIYRHWQAGDIPQAQTLHQSLLPWIQRWMGHCEYIIQVEKTILQRRGIIKSDFCRRPGWPLSQRDHKDIEQFIHQFQL
ncbi:dihydrodipicolinate synthase family protein [Salmonella enterica]|uniref:Dihydrodipicolinate synthase family protein n=3 Tax=Salmonella enterica TaxID=28901 RepID=A0A757YCI9_SALER|nr:dihydrodipicolinate synthase family protein [Salmonella enterica subsp. enterica serovar Koketime]EAB8207411.1 dihydrodipicolinate synthase family protein [Salmonella enterica subsp. enterica serovar Lattenkamp]EAM8931793.1 dihydrodipicolinate synthase family protein [Salmonella enterica]EBY0371927.1 dihydrodipicolinate synthase family protein [Salmonella enterica subsp. enterica serovar Toulon]ECG8591229.1 dihydrodipicolinate synthase family protein [Salmonella enterica subsp. salamae]ECJ3